jgi:hypothetical protein
MLRVDVCICNLMDIVTLFDNLIMHVCKWDLGSLALFSQTLYNFKWHVR